MRVLFEVKFMNLCCNNLPFQWWKSASQSQALEKQIDLTSTGFCQMGAMKRQKGKEVWDTVRSVAEIVNNGI